MSLVQSCMYLSLDRADIAFASKELARWNESPTQGHLASLRRLAGYIKAHLRVVNVFAWKGCAKQSKFFFQTATGLDVGAPESPPQVDASLWAVTCCAAGPRRRP